ncbi:putative retrotransposon gag domain-containing protein [Helianthus annuus]|nr:putative retrotransposon gag domain-containing protein [Helianthus annuus]
MAGRQTVHQESTAGFTGANSPITLPAINNDKSWKIPSYIFAVITNSCQFHGRDDEDAPAHISRLTRLCSTFSIEGANLDARFLLVFPFSLAGRAATWLDSQPAGTFTTWATLRDAFLAKYFPPAKASRLRDQIHSFRMEPDEPYHLAWERFQTLLSRCTQHGLFDWALVEKFYNGLTPETRARFDTSAGGHLLGKKTVAECNDLFESFAHSDIDLCPINRTSTPVSSTSSAGRGVHQVSLDTSMAATMENLERKLNSRMNDLERRFDRCEVCRGGHDTIDCPTLTVEQVEFIANRGPTNPFNNSNLGSNWRSNNNTFCSSGNPPGFQSISNQNRGHDYYSSGGSNQQGQFGSSGLVGQLNSGGSNSQGSNNQDLGSGLDEIKAMLSQILVKNQATEGTLEATQRALEATQRTLEDHSIFLKNNHSNFLDHQRQVSDINSQLQERSSGQFSGNTQPNTTNHHVKAISTRSGLELREVGSPPVRIEAVASVGESKGCERIETERVSDPRLEPMLEPKCGDPPDRRVEDLEKIVQCLESKLEALSEAQCGDRFRFETFKFKPPDDELRGCERYEEVWRDSGNHRYDGATAREIWYTGEPRLHDPP